MASTGASSTPTRPSSSRASSSTSPTPPTRPGPRPLKKTKTGPSTDAEVLEKLASDPTIETPIPDLILEYRQLTKLVNTYLVALKDEIHPAPGASTRASTRPSPPRGGSARDPNLQNIPIRTDIGREIRGPSSPRRGTVLISADYSQIELRLLAHLSRDPALIEAFHGMPTSTPRRRADPRRAARRRSRASSATARRWSTSASSTASRPSASPGAWVSATTEAAAIIDGYKNASPASRPSSRSASSRPAARLRRNDARPPPPIPTSTRATPAPGPGRAHGDQQRRAGLRRGPHQARDGRPAPAPCRCCCRSTTTGPTRLRTAPSSRSGPPPNAAERTYDRATRRSAGRRRRHTRHWARRRWPSAW
jgi:hypothetical protein